MNAPLKPPNKLVNRKSVLAYYSELRRWAKALERRSDELADQETELARAMTEFEMEHNQEDSDLLDTPIESDDECECTSENAEAGCDCPPCREWRSRRAQKMMASQQAAVKEGDELQWLEDLWKLPDRRRKKKQK